MRSTLNNRRLNSDVRTRHAVSGPARRSEVIGGSTDTVCRVPTGFDGNLFIINQIYINPSGECGATAVRRRSQKSSIMGKKFTSLILLLMAFLLAPPEAWAGTVTATFTDKNLNSSEDEITWTATPAFNSFESSGSARGPQSAKAAEAITISSGSITNATAITKVEVWCYHNGSASMTATVGGSPIGSSITLTKGTSPTLPYEFSGNVTGSSVTLNVTRSSSCTFWLKKVVITYTTSGGGGGGGDDPSGPANPTGLTLTPGNGQIAASWTAPTSGTTPTGYEVSISPSVNGYPKTVNTTSETITGLTNGTTYTVTVKSTDGTNQSAGVSKSATPAAVTTYELVTNASQLSAGDEVIIVNAAGTYGLRFQSGNYQTSSSVTVSGTTATPANDVTVLTLGGSSGAWTLKNGDYYLNGNTGSSSSNLTSTNTSSDGWSISIDSSDNHATMIYSTGSRAIGFNASASNRFAQYQTTNATYYVKLYKKAGAPKTPLTAPTVALATNGYNTATLDISPATDEASLIGDYTVTVTPSTGVTSSVSGTTISLTGLTGNTTYEVSVVANPTTAASATYSASPASTAVSFKTLPGAPTGLTGGSATSEGFTASWTAPAGGASSYTVEVYKSSDTSTAVATQTDATSPLTITGLESNTAYKFKVTATNASGSTASELSGEISTAAGNLYILGNVNGAAGFAPNEGVLMDYDSGMYSKTVYFTGTDNYFAFTTKLASQGGDNGWAEINGAGKYRRGAKSPNWVPFYITASDPGNDMGGTDTHGTYNWLSDQSNHNNGEWSYNLPRGLYLIEEEDFKMYVTPLPLTTTVSIPTATLKPKQLVAEWTAQANATKYVVSISPTPEGWTDQEVTATSYEFTDLTPLRPTP